jgi:hypothetical protein
MINDVFTAIGAAARKLFTNWGALLIAFLLFALLWGACYLFITIGLATTLQVTLALLLLPLVVVVLFFTLQALGLSYVRIGVGAGYLLKRAVQDCWKLLVISLPLIVLAGLIVYAAAKAENKWVREVETPRRWVELTITWARYLLLYFVLPLIGIHWWLAAVREGVAGALKGSLRGIARAFAPRSVLVYALIIGICGALAYFLFFTKTQFGGEWAQLWLFGFRFVLAWIIIFLGWLLVLGAQAELTAQRALRELES